MIINLRVCLGDLYCYHIRTKETISHIEILCLDCGAGGGEGGGVGAEDHHNLLPASLFTRLAVPGPGLR